jgi:hypothetical protein
MNKRIPVNIWDDFYDDGFVPEGKFQETYMYVEDDNLSHEETKATLELILNFIQNNTLIKGVEFELKYHDSKKLYPKLVGTEHEWCLYERWELKLRHLTHKKLDQLLKKLEKSNLKLNGSEIYFYSES